MNTFAHLERLFAYDDWANREVLTSVVSMVDPPPRALGLMAHIIAARRLWLMRLKGESVAVVVWPDLSADECWAQLDEVSMSWRLYLSGMTEESLSDQVSYTNSLGESYVSSVEDILTHITHHGAYHRGQIATIVRGAGHTPAYTDFIHWTRRA